MTQSNAWFRLFEIQALKAFLSIVNFIEKGRPKAISPRGKHSVLICKWCCMGDAILSLYAIREFKLRNPDLNLEMLVSSRIAEVYKQAPEINHVHILPVTGNRLILEFLQPKLWFDFIALVIRLRKKHFAQFIDLELYRGTGPVLKRLVGIPYSRGFQVEGAIPKGHDFEAPRKRSMPEWQCFYLVLGLEIPAAKPAPLFRINQGTRNRRTKRIGIVYGSSFNWPQKKWPSEYFAETITLLASGDHEFVLLGSSIEKEEGARIAKQAVGRIRDLSGTLSYLDLCTEVAECDLIVGNDTGTLHLASAYGVPTMTIFGPTDPVKWNGLTSTPIYLDGLACRPCYYLGSMPACSHYSCLRKLAPSLVAERVRSLLSPAEETAKR